MSSSRDWKSPEFAQFIRFGWFDRWHLVCFWYPMFHHSIIPVFRFWYLLFHHSIFPIPRYL